MSMSQTLHGTFVDQLMVAKLGILAFTFTIAVAATAAEDVDEGEIPKAIRAAIPRAASVSRADWNKLAYSETAPSASNAENQSLGVLFLVLPLPKERTAEHDAQFRLLAKTPRPSDLTRAFQPSRLSLLITPLQSGYIKSVTATVDGNQAVGTITFEAAGTYSGKVEYTARHAGEI